MAENSAFSSLVLMMIFVGSFWSYQFFERMLSFFEGIKVESAM